MKRRILAAVLSAALLLALAACGGGNGGGSSSNPGGGSSSQVDSSTSGGSSAGASQPDESGNPLNGSAGGSASSADGSGADVSEPDTGASDSAGGGSSAAGTKINLTLNRTNIELNKAGATFKLRYTVDPDIYDGLAVFTSSDTKVATVDESGTVKAVAPGKATITVTYDSASATASVNCNWKEEAGKPDASKPADDKPAGDTSEATGDPPAPGNVDLDAFYSSIIGKYEFPMPMLADDDILDNFYAGMTGISTEQRLIYVCGTSMNSGEFGLVQVKDSKDVDAVKNIFKARINYMVGDGNGPGGAYYPAAMDQWENNSRVVSNGNYVMMVVHENCDDIVKEFNALF